MEVARSAVMRDGVRIAYRCTRCASARGAVVLLHGLASNLTRWSEFVEHTSLTQGWHVMRIDLRGHGDSPTRGTISLECWCDDLAAILDAEGGATAVLIGHSLGAQVALKFATRHPQRTAALALIDPVFRQALHGRWKLLATCGPLLHGAALAVRGLNALGLRRRTIPALDLRALDAMARQALLSRQGSEEFIRLYSSTRADLRTFRTAHYLQDLAEMFRPAPAPESIGVPALLLLSAGGTFASLCESIAIARRFPNGRVVTIDCEHWPLTERPVEVREHIEQWCAAIAASARSA